MSMENNHGCGGCLGTLGLILIFVTVGLVAPWWLIVIFFGMYLVSLGGKK